MNHLWTLGKTLFPAWAVSFLVLPLSGGGAEPLATPRPNAPLDPKNLTLIYETNFHSPLNMIREEELFNEKGERVAKPDGKDWVLEGQSARAWTENGRLVIANSAEDDGERSHAVLWNTRVFPEDFVLEFEFSPSDSEMGLAIIFFATRSREGGSVFDLSLPKREGDFHQYHSGALNGYHVSYWAIHARTKKIRGFSNLRKNYGFHSLAPGKDLIAGQGPGPHVVRLTRIGGRIQLEENGEVVLSYEDDGSVGGPVWKDGYIGLRQMSHSEPCRYGCFKVWKVEE